MLEIVRGASLGTLAQRCAAVLADPPDDPFAPEWIATPTPGIARWLSLELARVLGASGPEADDGVIANTVFASAGDLRRTVLAAGREASGDAERWRPEAIVWTLCACYRDQSDALGLPMPADGATLTARARRTMRLFTRYDSDRPEMVRAWAAGRDVDPDGRPLADADRWQPRLFRSLRDRLGMPSPAERLPRLLEGLRDGSVDPELPQRLALFGFLAPPGGSGYTDLLDAVAVRREVRCYLYDPAPTGDPGDWHGLVRSWGTASAAGREVFARFDEQLETIDPTPPAGTASLLGHLQQSLQQGAVPEGTDVDAADTSIRVHGAQGARRQVEVLRDAMLSRLAAEPTLTEDDIVVYCADLDRFAPMIHSVLDGTATPPGERRSDVPAGTPVLRYRIDGGAGGPDNPVAVAVRAALRLLTGRFSALDVVEFCGLEAVRRRWGFDDDAWAAIRGWVTELDVRWGFDVDQRATAGVSPAIVAGTWRRALDRLALGAVFARDDLILGDTLVPHGIEGDRIETLGRLVDLITRLAAMAERAHRSLPVVERLQRLEADLESLVAPDDGAEWQLDALHRMCRVQDAEGGELADWVGEVSTTLAEVAPELLERLGGGGRRSGAFRGGITITTPKSLAGVPFRVACLLGFDEGIVPGSVRDGDDLTALTPNPGDPDPRAEMLAALLAAASSAGDALEIIHDRRDLTTNQELPDCVALAELWAEVLAVSGAAGFAASSLRLAHPRHGTDPACFIPGSIVPDAPWSFDPLALAGAEARRAVATAMTAEAVPAGTALGEGPPSPDAGNVALADLLDFYEAPARFLCRTVLDVRLPREDDTFEGHLRTDLSNLERHDVIRGILEARLASGESDAGDDRGGGGVEALTELLVAQDRLPVGIAGEADLAELDDEATRLAEEAMAHRAAGVDATSTVRVELPDGRLLVGQVPTRGSDAGHQVFSAAAGRIKLGHRLRAWVELLALAASHPGEPFTSVLIRRGAKSGKPPATAELRLTEADPEVLAAHLGRLVAWFDAFCRRPEAFLFEAFASCVTAAGGTTTVDELDPRDVTADWNEAGRYATELDFLVGERTVAEILTAPLLDDDPVSSSDLGRVPALVDEVDRIWVATVDVPEGGG